MNAPPYTVRQAMAKCGINDTDLYETETPAKRFANELFNNSFELCMDKTIEELKSDLKQYASLGSFEGQILTTPGNIQKIHAFIQWTRDMIRTGLEPSSMEFPVGNTAILIKFFKSHQAYMDKTKTISDAAKPTKFKENKKIGIQHSLTSYALYQGGMVYPLVIFVGIMASHQDMISTWISLITTAEVKMLPYVQLCDGRLDYKSLQDHYEGVRRDILIKPPQCNQTINNLHYSGEKRPHMWWGEFEKRLTYAFTVVDKREHRVVYSDEMKLRM